MSTEDFYDDATGELHVSVTTDGLAPGDCIAFSFHHDDGEIETFTFDAEEAIRLSDLADEAYDRAITEAHATTVTIDLPGPIVEAMLDGELAESDLTDILGLISDQINNEPCSNNEGYGCEAGTECVEEECDVTGLKFIPLGSFDPSTIIADMKLPPASELFNGIIPGLGDLLDRLADAEEALEDEDE